MTKKKKKHKPFPKTRKFGRKQYHTPSFHGDKKSADYIAANYRKRGGNARVVKGKNILGDTRYVVYRHGGAAGKVRSMLKKRK